MRSFLRPTASSSHLVLKDPLGPWIDTSNTTWGATVHETTLNRRDPSTHTGERNIAVHFPRFMQRSDDTQVIYYENPPDWYAATTPFNAIPADITGEHIFSASYATKEYPAISKPADNFHHWIDQRPPAEHCLISSVYYEMCDGQARLAQYLALDCTLFIGTDGGKRQHAGSFSWIICSPTHEKLVFNSGPVDGWHKCQNSLRSEAAALASITLYLDELATFAPLTIRCTFQQYVDSTSAISNVKTLRDLIPKRRFADNADLLSPMRSAHYVISHFRFEHVKSHQDDKMDFDKLPFPAQLNVLCDAMATEQLKLQESEPAAQSLASPLRPRTLPVEVSYGAQVISSHHVSRLCEEITLSQHRKYLQTKYHWSEQVVENLAWTAFEFCATRPDLDQHATRSKLVHNWLNLGKQRATIGRCPDKNLERRCPYCAATEDFLHLLICPAPRAAKSRYDATMKLRKRLDESQGGAAILSVIKAWTIDPHSAITIQAKSLTFQPVITLAIRNQNSIGWVHLFRGFISINWGMIYSKTDPTPPP